MGIGVLWTSVSTPQGAVFAAARRDAGLLTAGFVACPLWTTGPMRVNRLPGRQNSSRRDRDVYGDRT